jgi:hypothetical protein
MKYNCTCGNEISKLCAAWASYGGQRPVAFETWLLCNQCGEKWKERIMYDCSKYHCTFMPITINVPTKERAVAQIIAQYLNKEGSFYYLPKSDIKNALSRVVKKII